MSVTQATLLGDTFGSQASGTVPVGGIIMWSGTTTPTGWQLCNGTNLPSTSPLRPTITTTPDLRDRFIVGTGNNYSVGDTGGSNTVTLTVNEMPSHRHTISDSGNHEHKMFTPNVNDQELTAGNQSVARVGNGGYDDSRKDYGMARSDNPTTDTPVYGRTSQNGNHDHGGETGLKGESKAHENRPPYYALAFIMRVS